MKFPSPPLRKYSRHVAKIFTAVSLSLGFASSLDAQTLTSNETGTHDGFYYSFWKDTGDASFTLYSGGRYASDWGSGTNNWVGGKGWKPGGAKVINYDGYYGVDSSQNSYIAVYGWSRNPLIEYYIIESYGSYDPSSCSGGTDYGTFESDGATYKVRRCERIQQPSIEGTQTFYQYFSVRTPKKGFGNISGTVTTQNHFDYWASKGLNLGSFDYMVLATEGYRSTGNSDITVSEGTAQNSPGSSSSPIVVAARGVSGNERIDLKVADSVVKTWTLSTSTQEYTYSGGAVGDVVVEYTNDASGMDAILDYVIVNGETRQAEDMEYNTATYGNGSCGGGSYSETMHCSGEIGFGHTDDCFSGNCSATTSSSSSISSVASSSSSSSSSSSAPTTGAHSVDVRMLGIMGTESVSLEVGGHVVATWTLSTSMDTYYASTDYTGDIKVVYGNDSGNMDVQVDYITVNGETRQAEDQSSNTGYYTNGSCGGGGYSEMMHCSGAINFGPVDGSSTGGETSSSSASPQMCNWYGSNIPMCQTTTSGWGWENNQSCVSVSTCNSQ